MEKLFDDKKYSDMAIQANNEGKCLYQYIHDVEYEAEVLEWDIIEEEKTVPKYDEDGNPVTHTEAVVNPIYNEAGEIIGYNPPTEIEVQETETITVETRVPKMVEEPVIDPETGEPMIDPETGEVITHEVQAHHTETFTKQVCELLIEDFNYYICFEENLTYGEVNPNYEEEKEQKEKERVANLQCTKRVFIMILEELQLNYFEQILPIIEANRDAKLQWDLCVQLERKNPLLDQLADQFGITSEQLNNLFKYANGEISIEEFIPQQQIDYSQYTVAQLKAMADEKGLSYTSNILKADLIALLEQNI